MLDLYKAYLSDLQSLGTRYTASNSFFLTVLTVLVSVLALSEGTKPLGEIRLGVILGVCLFALIVCWTWHRGIAAYRHLFAAKFAVLREMEQKLEFPVYAAEAKALGGHVGLLKNDEYVPLIIGALFVVILTLALIFRSH